MKVIDSGDGVLVPVDEASVIADLPLDAYDKTDQGSIATIPKVETDAGIPYLEKRHVRYDPITGERTNDYVERVYLDQLTGMRDMLNKELAIVQADIDKINSGLTVEQHKQ